MLFYFWIVCAFILLIEIDVISGLSCSQCESVPGGDCMTSPPPAIPCESKDGDNTNNNCMIARYLTDNGTLVFFSRGCTSVVVGDGCVPYDENVTLCYKNCHYDHCNKGRNPSFLKQHAIALYTVLFIIHNTLL